MSNKRLFVLIAAAAMLVVSTMIVGTSPALPIGATDFFQRHSEMVNSRINVEPMDYFQRHPDSLNPGNAVDLTDYYARHWGDSTVLNTPGASDWFQRHPDVLNSSNAVDLTDYYARHPGASIGAQPAMSAGSSPSAEVVNGRFPGKEQDDLVTTRPSYEWHTPAYQGYTP